MTAFNDLCENIFPGDAVRQTNAVMGLSAFKHGDGLYGKEAAKLAASQMPGYRWSQMFSGGHEDFQRAQSTALALFTSQSPTERNHKAEAMCKTKARNNPKFATTDKVLYVSCNSLEDKTKSILYRELHMQWMEAPDGANGVAITKQKNLKEGSAH
jgi:hypothetical protein